MINWLSPLPPANELTAVSHGVSRYVWISSYTNQDLMVQDNYCLVLFVNEFTILPTISHGTIMT